VTWTKLGIEFFDECAQAGLSDAAVRTHVEALGWLYRVESPDLKITKHLVRRFAGSPHWESAVAELVARGWWHDSANAYVVVHHADVFRQSVAAQQAKRIRDKKAQEAHREREAKKAVAGSAKFEHVSADTSAYTGSQTNSHQGEGSEYDAASRFYAEAR